MARFATTRMSSKGQVVIPEQIREDLHLEEGEQFIVMGKGDTVILKAITAPSLDDFSDLLKDARRQAQKAGLKKTSVASAIAKVRRKHK